jgi:creatinine amidohydrolase
MTVISNSFCLAELPWPAIEKYLESRKTIIIPIGATEQHGRSLPLGTDAEIAKYISKRVAEATGTLCIPCIPFGESSTHIAFSGTLTLSPTTIIMLVRDLCVSLYTHGFRNFLFVNGHGDNSPCLQAAMQEFCASHNSVRYRVQDFWAFKEVKDLMEKHFSDRQGGHADASDASIMLAIRPESVIREEFTKNYTLAKFWASPDETRKYFTKCGVINSDQALADAQIGLALLEASIAGYTKCIPYFEECLNEY